MEDLSLDERITVKLILKKWDGKPWSELSGPEQGPVTSCCEDGNELSVSIKFV